MRKRLAEREGVRFRNQRRKGALLGDKLNDAGGGNETVPSIIHTQIDRTRRVGLR